MRIHSSIIQSRLIINILTNPRSFYLISTVLQGDSLTTVAKLWSIGFLHQFSKIWISSALAASFHSQKLTIITAAIADDRMHSLNACFGLRWSMADLTLSPQANFLANFAHGTEMSANYVRTVSRLAALPCPASLKRLGRHYWSLQSFSGLIGSRCCDESDRDCRLSMRLH